jgi:hypothetical protein
MSSSGQRVDDRDPVDALARRAGFLLAAMRFARSYSTLGGWDLIGERVA